MIDSDDVIDQKVSRCLHCGHPKVALLRKYKEDSFGNPTTWTRERAVEVKGMDKEDDERVEHVWCSSCGILYHPNSV